MMQARFLGKGAPMALERVYAQGPYYEIYEVVTAPGESAQLLKVPKAEPDAGPLYLSSRSVIFSRLWSMRSSSGDVASPTGELLERLLESQARRIQESEGAWNHEVLEAGALEIEGRETYGLLMPKHDGEALGSMDRGRQRVLFPMMLLALWDALSSAPHLDLSPENLWIDAPRGRFMLLDPGAWVADYTPGSDSRTQVHFVTNPERYPVLGPHLPVLMEQGRDLGAYFEASVNVFRGVAESRRFGGSNLAPVSETLPAPRAGSGIYAADLHALGIMYYEILTGEHPYFEASGGEAAWMGNEATDNPNEDLGPGLVRGKGWAESPAPDARERASDVTHGEALLAKALLEMRVSSRTDLLAAMGPLMRENS